MPVKFKDLAKNVERQPPPFSHLCGRRQHDRITSNDVVINAPIKRLFRMMIKFVLISGCIHYDVPRDLTVVV